MSRNVRRRLTLPGEEQAAPPAIVKDELEEFSKRLNHHLISKGWSGSDLARAIWGESRPDSKGYLQVRGKDRASAWLRAKSYPDPKHLAAIARVLNVTPEELAPNLAGKAIAQTAPEIEMKMIAGHSDKVMLRVYKLVPLKVAVQVIGLLGDLD